MSPDTSYKIPLCSDSGRNKRQRVYINSSFVVWGCRLRSDKIKGFEIPCKTARVTCSAGWRTKRQILGHCQLINIRQAHRHGLSPPRSQHCGRLERTRYQVQLPRRRTAQWKGLFESPKGILSPRGSSRYIVVHNIHGDVAGTCPKILKGAAPRVIGEGFIECLFPTC